jgi:hypothetical protein
MLSSCSIPEEGTCQKGSQRAFREPRSAGTARPAPRSRGWAVRRGGLVEGDPGQKGPDSSGGISPVSPQP